MNTPIILLFSKKWIPGLAAEDNNIICDLTSLVKLDLDLEPDVLATTNDESVWISYADISLLASSIVVTMSS